jgi:hypothetical protein
MPASWIEPFEEWAQRRAWAPRAVVVAAWLWLGVGLLADPDRSTIFDGIDLGIHEAGHLLFRFGGDVLCAFGGTLLQCLAPCIAGVLLARRPDWFGVAFCGAWLGVNLFGVAHYMADARAQQLPLVTVGGGEAKHDWTFLLGWAGCLRADTALAACVRVLAHLVLWSSIAASAGLVLLMWRSRRTGIASGPTRPSESGAPRFRIVGGAPVSAGAADPASPPRPASPGAPPRADSRSSAAARR